MKCDVCHQREASTQVRVRMNGVTGQVRLCPTCLSEVSAGHAVGGGFSPFNNQGSNPWENLFGAMGASGPQVQAGAKQSPGGFLEQFGRNISGLAKNGRIDPVIGRDPEVARVIGILNRRNKNNPVLIGEPGVGKTAIAEGLALRILEGNVPAKLRDKQVVSLDVAALVADTGIRGQFEERMRGLITELEAHPEVVLFIDEIHLLVGAGSAQGSMDAGNILKPALARGDIQVIGATTLKEYRQIEKDAALERRFQPVMVDEPSVDEAVQILRGLREKYEDYHQVSFEEEALVACVTLSSRYISDRFLPDKAIDLMDEAGSLANLQLGDSDLATALQQVLADKEQATKSEDYERAAQLRDEEQRLRAQMATGQATDRVIVTVADIERIVEDKTGIPVGKIEASEQSQLRSLEEDLAARVIGQAEAVRTVAKAVRRSRAGMRKGERPISSLLFVGPTGVGKTELAKSLALVLFGSKDAMIRLDMSEYMEKHAVSKLIGSPPGYVGYEDAGQLTERVRRNPYSLILLDEIEKAHPDVQHMFLQIMEDGRLTDSQGRVVSFKDAIIIMTSNAGARESKVSLGFSVSDDVSQPAPMTNLDGFFKPEFLNRFDAIVDFGPLTKTDLRKIVALFLNELKATLSVQGITVEWTERATDKLGELGYHPAFGARPLRRVIQDQVEDRIADVLLDADAAGPLCVDVDESGEIVIRVTSVVKA